MLTGRLVPFTTTQVYPIATAVTRILSIKLNVPVDPARFEFHDGSSPKEARAASAENANSSPVAPPKPGPGGPETPSKVTADATRLKTFELVWQKVNDSYWDKTFNGVDWKGVHDKYLPLVKAADKQDQFYSLLTQMLGELHVSHFRIIPPEEAAGLHTSAEDLKNGVLGLDLRWLDGQLVVFDVDKDYPAYASGIRPGFVISKIEGKTPDEIFTEHRAKNPGFEVKEEFVRVRAAQRLLGGKPDTTVKIEVLNERDQPMKLEIKRKAHPQNPLEFESKRINSKIGCQDQHFLR
jgi:C-terminal processing protease CtpA/Prc